MSDDPPVWDPSQFMELRPYVPSFINMVENTRDRIKDIIDSTIKSSADLDERHTSALLVEWENNRAIAEEGAVQLARLAAESPREVQHWRDGILRSMVECYVYSSLIAALNKKSHE